MTPSGVEYQMGARSLGSTLVVPSNAAQKLSTRQLEPGLSGVTM